MAVEFNLCNATHFPQVQKYFPPGGYCDFLLVNLFRKRWGRVPRLIKREHRTFLYFLHVVACEMLPFFSPQRDGSLHISNPRCNRWKKVQRGFAQFYSYTSAGEKESVPTYFISLMFAMLTRRLRWCLAFSWISRLENILDVSRVQMSFIVKDS